MHVSQSNLRPGSLMLERLAALRLTDLPEGVTGQVGRVLLDNLACGLLGASLPWGRMVAEHVIEEGSRGGASVFGHSARIAPARAALANGTAIHGYELDDIILGSLAHPGTVVVPAALGMAEHLDAPVDRLLLGIVAGYEAMARLGAALGEECNTRGFHTTGVAGAIAAAVAAGIVLGLDADGLKRAVGIACSSASGIKAFTQGTGGMVKRLHGGHAAECGVTAAQLAARGFTGPLEALDGKFGLLEVIGGGGAEPHLLAERWGEDWAIGRVWTKVYSCCGVIHGAMSGIEALRRDHQLGPEDVRRLRIGIGRRAVEQNGSRAPEEPMSAQYSLPFCAAVAVVGDIRDPASFEGEALHDARVRGMVERIELVVDAEVHAAYPQRFGARVSIETPSGERFERLVWDAHGMAADPCSDEEIERKFHKLAGSRMAPPQVERVLGAVAAIGAGTGSVHALSAALCHA